MEWKTEWRPLAWIVAVFLACFWLPVGGARMGMNGARKGMRCGWFFRELGYEADPCKMLLRLTPVDQVA